MHALTVPHRFNGPPHSGNGGWVAGALASALAHQAVGQAVTVTLRQPPPLATPMPVSVTAQGADLTHNGRTVAEARYAEVAPVVVAPVSAQDAAQAEADFPGLRHHPFPTCFVCGTDRRAGDGLRIFPGPVPGAASGTDGGDGVRRVASTWTPYESGLPVTWAALDCPGGWASDLQARPSLLGRITVEVRAFPRTSERYVAVGEQRGIDGRKTHTAATLYGPDGEVIATAEHVWIAIDLERFR